MPVLSPENRVKTIQILERVRADVLDIAGDDQTLLFQMRRYIAKRLEFDERGTPAQRRKLKELKWKKQRGLCARCNGELPERGSELDRLKAIEGYTIENTQLVCHKCHREVQEERGFA